MAIKYDLHTIKNASGSGQERKYVQILMSQTVSTDELEKEIEEMCTVNAADVRAVMSALSQVAAQKLSEGNRVHLPGIGYLSLSVGNVPPSEKRDGKITGKDIFVRSVKFKAEASFLSEVTKGVRFEKADFTTSSAQYNEADLKARLKEYLSEHHFITCRQMQTAFGLSRYKASQWLSRFTADGILIKEGPRHDHVYFPSGSGE